MKYSLTLLLQFLFVIPFHVLLSITVLNVVPRASGSYHVERAILPSGEYDWVVHSAPIDSLVTLMSLRVAEILYDRMCYSSDFTLFSCYSHCRAT